MNKKSKNNMLVHWLSILRKSGINFLLFELIYKLCAIVIGYPLIVLGFNFTLKKAGFKYLTNDYFFTYIRSPFTIVFILIIIAVAFLYIFYETMCVSVCFDAAYHNRQIGILQIFKAGKKLAGHGLKKKKINTVFNITIVTIMTNITLLGFWLSNINLPDSVKKVIKSNAFIFIMVAVLLLGLFIYSMFHIFTPHFMTYDGNDISDARRKSRNLIKRRMLKTFLVLVMWNVAILAAIYLVYFILLLIIVLGSLLLNRVNVGMAVFLSSFRIVITVVKIMLVIVSMPVSYCVVSGLFYKYRGDYGDEYNIGIVTRGVIDGSEKNTDKKFRLPAWITVAVSLAISIVYLVLSFDNNPFGKVELFSDTQVMAHRGSSYNVPENTMLAFENAVAATADYIELDVHETKDGEIVVIHDANLKRTTGVKKYVWDVTLDEIKKLDAGSWFGDEEEYKQCTIPTLKEVMEYTQGKIKLNIEIKLSKNEPDLVKKVAGYIEEYDYVGECVVTSMNYEALVEIKQINPDIKTGYVLQVAYGSFYNIDYVDSFSINSGFVNKNVVDAIHNRGKEIYVWTINGKNKAKELTVMGVDGIITDNPSMAREVVYAKYSNTLIQNVLSYVFTN